MLIEMLYSKIHRATVTDANLNYVGSITIDEELMQASGIREGQKVDILDINNGERFSTYVITGKRGNRDICLNGAAARKVAIGDKVIIVDYKTNRPAAKTLADVPEAYFTQLHSYKELVQRIYPNKLIETYLLWTNTCNMMKV